MKMKAAFILSPTRLGHLVQHRLPAMLPAISKVAVIGAGAAGLPAAKRLRDYGIEVVIFERNSVAGGGWIYQEQKPIRPLFPSVRQSLHPSKPDRPSPPPEGQRLPFTEYCDDDAVWLVHAPPGPCYESLVINIEVGLMKFEGHEYPPGTDRFVDHRCVLEYLQKFSEDLGLGSITRYNTSVEGLEKITEGGKSVWKILSRELSRDHLGRTVGTWSEETFDAVVSACGHYNVEYVPDIPGLAEWAEKWPDSVRHAKEFRRPEDRDDKAIIVVGTGFSSIDILREMSPFVKDLYLSVRDETNCSPDAKVFRRMARFLDPENLTQVAEIVRFGPVDRALRSSETQIFLKDGTVLEGIDRVVFCTGYLYTMPFLKFPQQDWSPSSANANVSEEAIITDAMQMHNLHKDIFYIHDPTLAFIGVPHGVATFPFFDAQAIAVAAVFAGKAALPTVSEMRSEYADRKATKGQGRKMHGLGFGSERKYLEDIAGWIHGGNTGHDENWYQTRLASLEMFLRNRLEKKDVDAEEMEDMAVQLREAVARLRAVRENA